MVMNLVKISQNLSYQLVMFYYITKIFHIGLSILVLGMPSVIVLGMPSVTLQSACCFAVTISMIDL